MMFGSINVYYIIINNLKAELIRNRILRAN